MKVLFVFPPDVSRPPYPPLGLGYLAAAVERAGHEAAVADASLDGSSIPQVVDLVGRLAPSAVGVSVFTHRYHVASSLVSAVKDSYPGVTVFAGGPHVTVLPERTLAELPLDYVVVGEGERTTLELLEVLEGARDKRTVRGLGFRDRGTVVVNPKRDYIQNLDELPFPARHLMQITRYRGDRQVKRVPYTTVLATRGCPFDCVFCCNAALWGRVHRHRTPENVVQEMLGVNKEYGIQEIYFPDDLFTGNKQWVMRLCELIRDTGVGFTWKCLSRVDTVDEELLGAMKAAGCHTLNFGVESGDERILRNIRKRINLEQVKPAFEVARRLGFDTYAYFMIGNIGETEPTVCRTIRLAEELNPDFVSFSLATPLPGTDFYARAVQEDLVFDTNWAHYDYSDTAVVRTDHLSATDIQKWQKRAYQQVYGRWRYLSRNVLAKLTWYDPVNLNDWIRVLKKLTLHVSSLLRYPITRRPFAKRSCRGETGR